MVRVFLRKVVTTIGMKYKYWIVKISYAEHSESFRYTEIVNSPVYSPVNSSLRFDQWAGITRMKAITDTRKREKLSRLFGRYVWDTFMYGLAHGDWTEE